MCARESRGPSLIVLPAVNEFPHEKIRRLFLQRPVMIAGRVETRRRNAESLIQGTEIGVEGDSIREKRVCMLLTFAWGRSLVIVLTAWGES